MLMQDEIGTEAEALAARSIAQRGVQLVATAHGGELARLIKNPTLSDLIGGIQTCVSSHSHCTSPFPIVPYLRHERQMQCADCSPILRRKPRIPAFMGLYLFLVWAPSLGPW